MPREAKYSGRMKSRGLVDIYSVTTPFPKAVFTGALLPGSMQSLPGSPIGDWVPVPSGRTAGCQFLQCLVSFVLLHNLTHWYSKEYYRKFVPWEFRNAVSFGFVGSFLCCE